MKNIFFITGLALILTFSLCGSVFANEINDEITNANVVEQEYDALEEVSVIESNGLTATAKRFNADYLRVVFKNSTSSKITDTVVVGDTLVLPYIISGPFSISVPANGSQTYDVYVGTYSDCYLITNNHGSFYFSF